MKPFAHLRHAAQTDVGRKRKNNEDSFGAFPAVGVFCVADGMGGGDDGEVASAAVVRSVELLAASARPPENTAYSSDDVAEAIGGAVSSASKWIFERAAANDLKGCGSTFVGVCFDASRPSAAKALHAGDSRLYRIRGKSIRQITKDHSAAEMIGAKNEDEVNPMFRGMILRAVGTQPSVELEVTPFDVKEHDFVLMCSDGLYRMVPEKKIVSIVRECAEPKEAVGRLISAANEAGGIDNVTAVLVEVGPLPAPLPATDMPKVPREAVGMEARTKTEEPETGDSGARSDATFDVATSTSATFATSAGTETRATKSTMTIPEEEPSEEPVEAVDAAGQKQNENAGAPAPRPGFFSCAKARMAWYVLSAFLAVGVIAAVAIGISNSNRKSREAEMKALAELKEAERLAEEGEAKRKAAEEEAKRKAEEKAAEERRKAEEAERKRLAEETEAKRKAAEAEAKRKAAAEEAERKRLAEEVEAKRKAAEAEAKRKAAEAEAKRKAEEAERKRLEEEAAEARRKAEETERKRLAEEAAEKRRLAEEAEAKRKAEILEKAKPKLEAARFYCESGEILQALKEYKAANDVGYLLTSDELAIVRELYGWKSDELNRRIRNKNLATENERAMLKRDLDELGILFSEIKSER